MTRQPQDEDAGTPCPAPDHHTAERTPEAGNGKDPLNVILSAVFMSGRNTAGCVLIFAAFSGLLAALVAGRMEGFIGFGYDGLVGGMLIAQNPAFVRLAQIRAGATCLVGLVGMCLEGTSAVVPIFGMALLSLLIGHPSSLRCMFSGGICFLILGFGFCVYALGFVLNASGIVC